MEEDSFALAELEAAFKMPRAHAYRKLTGGFAKGALLAQITYWNLPSKAGASKLRVERFDRLWIAKTRTDWMKECGLSLQQYKNALNFLKDYHLIETKQMKFKGLTMSHISLNLGALRLLIHGTPVVPLTPPGWCYSLHPNGVKGTTLTEGLKAPPLNTYITGQSITTETSSCSAPPVGAGGVGEGGVGGTGSKKKIKEGNFKQEKNFKEKIKLGEKMNADEIIALHKQKKHEALYGTNKVALAIIWQKLCSNLSGKQSLPLTQKQRGQLKQMEKKVGHHTPALLVYTLEHWDKFVARAVAEDGLDHGPTTPNTGFLLGHLGAANGLFLQSIAPKPPLPFAHETKEVYAASKETTKAESEAPLPLNFWEDLLEKLKPHGD